MKSRWDKAIQGIPSTGFVSIALIAIFIFLEFYEDSSRKKYCLQSDDVWSNFQVERLLFSAFFHWGKEHLFFNCLSLYMIGPSLERKLGPMKFSGLVGLFILLSNSLYVLFQILLREKSSFPFEDSCAVGFSGVLFALQAVQQGPSMEGLISILSELALMQLIFSEASFLGHFCGILSGYFYVWVLEPIVNKEPIVIQENSKQGNGLRKYLASFKIVLQFLAALLTLTSLFWIWTKYQSSGSLQDVLRDLWFNILEFFEDLTSGDLWHDIQKGLRRQLRRRKVFQPTHQEPDWWGSLRNIFQPVIPLQEEPVEDMKTLLTNWMFVCLFVFTSLSVLFIVRGVMASYKKRQFIRSSVSDSQRKSADSKLLADVAESRKVQ